MRNPGLDPGGIEDCLIYLEYPDPWRTIPMRAFANLRSAEGIIYGIIVDVLNNDAEMPETQFTQLA